MSKEVNKSGKKGRGGGGDLKGEGKKREAEKSSRKLEERHEEKGRGARKFIYHFRGKEKGQKGEGRENRRGKKRPKADRGSVLKKKKKKREKGTPLPGFRMGRGGGNLDT